MSTKLSDEEEDEQRTNAALLPQFTQSESEGLQQLQSCDAQEHTQQMNTQSWSTAQATTPGFWAKVVSHTVGSPMLLPVLAAGTCVVLCVAFRNSSIVRRHSS